MGGPEALRIEMLGAFSVSVGSRTIRQNEWRLTKAAALVKLLSLASGHRLHREQVMHVLWPNSGRSAASNNLRRVLHSARKALDPVEGSRYLASEGDSLVLCPSADLWVDVEAFEDAAIAARRSGDPAAYRAALDLYAGDLLPADRYEGWAEEKRAELRRLYLELLVELATACEERGDLGRAVEALRIAVAKEPALEEAHAALMRLYALLGQEVGASAQYERLRDALSKELGMEPSTATKRLRDEIASGELPSALSLTTSPPQKDEEPPYSPRHNLPAPRTSFIGREREMLEVKRGLAMTRLLTLAGTGGSGKTRLALEVARDLVGAYPDGVWLAQLAPLTEGSLVPQAVARGVGVKERPGEPLTDTLAEFLRTKQVLLVLDNCEHLVEAVARVVDLLLDACPGLRVLATSREPLGIAGEMKQLVGSLSVPDLQQQTMEPDLEAYESVRLFAERARYHNPAFVLTPQNVQAVARICERLDGIPLALELAAARVGLSVEQIATRLDDSLKLLTTGSRTASARQRTLRGALDWSYDLLSEPERVLFARLSVFAGGWTLEAAEAIGSGEGIKESEVLDLLSGLVDKSLVVAEATGEGAVRYRMLEPVRQYSRKHLEESGGVETTRSKHAGFFLALAEEADWQLRGPRQGTWLERLETEHDNMRAALSWALEGGKTELALRLAGALWIFWHALGQLAEGRKWLEPAIARDAGAPVEARVKALEALFWLTDQSDLERAEAVAQKAVELSNEAEPGGSLAASLPIMLAAPAWSRGDYERAKELLEESLALSREAGDKVMTVEALLQLGRIPTSSPDDLAWAKEIYEEGIALCREAGYTFRLPLFLVSLGYVFLLEGDYERGAALSEEAAGLCRTRGYKDGLLYALNNLGWAALLQGDHEQAKTSFKEGLTLCKEFNDKMVGSEVLEGLACVAVAQGEAEQAAWFFGAAEAQQGTLGEAVAYQHTPEEDAWREPYRASVRSQLGEVAWEEALARGRTMGVEEAVEHALGRQGSVRPSLFVSERLSAATHIPNLTRREREVAQIVAIGFTNRQVAQELVISEHTVESHMARILKKLNLHSREQIASRLTQP